ncbi:4-(cytidine 5'-diphospho)-2-C-methyl-D-erythritol kinase [Eubacteriales bacterium OttesenSCG-928-M02]|nr:4-(cytidine 5'-diphospho)-2-C-methyl-D-erythritol kinase [Eubacteriales bacterium OttesenSCG-928-M02]
MVQLMCYGKLNLTLDVVQKRQDGYHDLESIFHTVSVFDEITLEQDPTIMGVDVHSTVPIDGENIVEAAVDIFFRITRIQPVGIRIHIDKRIPIKAGLGGGSANAAGVLLGLCHMFRVNPSPSALNKAALYLGADVPFLLKGGSALGCGIGETLFPVDCKEQLHFLLVKPEEGLSTKTIFDASDLKPITNRPDNEAFMVNLIDGNVRDLGHYAGNVLEPIAIDHLPVLSSIRDSLLASGAIYAAMTGTGSTMFGLYENKLSALRAYEGFFGKFPYVEYAFSVPNGVEIFDQI